ncbi:MAG TPA: PH domain-containing protein [Acidimicrobiales bacterium]|nr:PH domain-containing protein [Acidimicrobiales bacterium]
MAQDVLGSIEELARRLPSRLGVKRELKKLPSLLMAGERVLQLDTGTYAGTNGLVVATDQRIMFMLEGLTRSRHEDFPYDEVSSVRSEVGMMTGTCRLTVTTLDRQAEITNMSKAVVDEITEYIRQRAGAVGEERQPAEPEAADHPPAPPYPVRREIEGANLFLVGAFNPAVLQPDWFASQGLISHEEAYVANIQTSHRDRLVFTTDTFDLKASTEQLVIGSTNPPAFGRLGDIVRTVLEEVRPPIGKLGLNNDVHFRLPSADSWEQIAQRLAPAGSWNGLLPQPRMRSLQFQGERSDGRPGAVFVRVEPSIRVRPGAYIQVNDHYEIANPGSPRGTEDAARIVSESWSRSFSHSEAISHQVLFGTT